MHAFPSRTSTQFAHRRQSLLLPHRKGQQPNLSTKRSGARKAVPVTRGQELGLRFRPDERESPYGQSAAPQGNLESEGYASELHSQFRPARPKRKPTYEELQAGSASAQPMLRPMMPYPVMPTPPLPAYGRSWPGW